MYMLLHLMVSYRFLRLYIFLHSLLSSYSSDLLVQLLSHVWHFATPWLKHIRPPCPSPTPRACSNSCPLSQWYHPTISFSVIPFSSCFQSFPESGPFPMSRLFASVGQSIGASVSVLPVNIQDWLPLRLTCLISLQSKGLSRAFPAPQFKVISSTLLSLFYCQAFTSIHNYQKNCNFGYTNLFRQSNVSAFQYAV